ncbi:DUF3488 domain-containing protein [Paenibacillus sp. P26]|nr:DUF3488 domain-containing protein [Paenibacillus sp. P26]
MPQPAPKRLVADAALSALGVQPLEWLYPLQRLAGVTEIYSIRPFAVIFIGLLALDIFRWRGGIVWPLKPLGLVLMTAWLHNGQALPSADGWADWGHALWRDAAAGLQGNLADWRPATRTLLFLAGWAFFISVVQSFVLERRPVLWLTLMTLVYLLVMQTVFEVDLFYGVLRTVGAGFWLQALLQSGRRERWNAEGSAPAPRPEGSLEKAAVLPSLVLVAMGLAAGWLGASFHPAPVKPQDWPRYLEAWAERVHGDLPSSAALPGEREAAWAVTGYSSDDTQLGRPLKPSDQPVFTAVTTRLVPWRGEVKNRYTGHGWTEPDGDPVQNIGGAALAASSGEAPWLERVTQEVTVQSPSINRLLFAGEISYS